MLLVQLVFDSKCMIVFLSCVRLTLSPVHAAWLGLTACRQGVYLETHRRPQLLLLSYTVPHRTPCLDLQPVDH